MKKISIILVLGMLLASSLVAAGFWDRITGKQVVATTQLGSVNSAAAQKLNTVACKVIDVPFVPGVEANLPDKTANRLCQENNAGACAAQIKSIRRTYFTDAFSCKLEEVNGKLNKIYHNLDLEQISKCDGLKFKTTTGNCLKNMMGFGQARSYQETTKDAKVLCCKLVVA